MEQNKNKNFEFTIQEASKFLGVTTKTIYNYIKKGILKGNKWNGVWLIEKEIIIELKDKLNRTSEVSSQRSKLDEQNREGYFWVEKTHYEEMVRMAGQLQAAERLLTEYRSENLSLRDQIRGLEREVNRLSEAGKKRGIIERLRNPRK